MFRPRPAPTPSPVAPLTRASAASCSWQRTRPLARHQGRVPVPSRYRTALSTARTQASATGERPGRCAAVSLAAPVGLLPTGVRAVLPRASRPPPCALGPHTSIGRRHCAHSGSNNSSSRHSRTKARRSASISRERPASSPYTKCDVPVWCQWVGVSDGTSELGVFAGGVLSKGGVTVVGRCVRRPRLSWGGTPRSVPLS